MEPGALVLLSPLTVGLVFWLIDEGCMGKYVFGGQGVVGTRRERIDCDLCVEKSELRTTSNRR